MIDRIKDDWNRRRTELLSFWGLLEREHETLGDRADPGAMWARPQLEQGAARVTADVARADQAFAELGAAYAAYDAAAAEAHRTAVPLDAPDAAHLLHIHARRAEARAAAELDRAARGFVMPSPGSYPLYRGRSDFLTLTVNGLSETDQLAKKAPALSSYEPGGRNSSDAKTAADCAYQGGSADPLRMVFEIVAESGHPEACAIFQIRWERFARLQKLDESSATATE